MTAKPDHVLIAPSPLLEELEWTEDRDGRGRYTVRVPMPTVTWRQLQQPAPTWRDRVADAIGLFADAIADLADWVRYSSQP